MEETRDRRETLGMMSPKLDRRQRAWALPCRLLTPVVPGSQLIRQNCRDMAHKPVATRPRPLGYSRRRPGSSATNFESSASTPPATAHPPAPPGKPDPDKLSDVVKALYQVEVRGFTVSRVQGHGGEMESVENYRGTSVKMDLTDKVMLDIAVSGPFVDVTMEAVLGSARTGEVGTGRSSFFPSRGCGGFGRPRGTRRRSRLSLPGGAQVRNLDRQTAKREATVGRVDSRPGDT